MSIALEFQDLFAIDDDGASDEQDDFVGAFIKTQELAAIGINTDKLARELAPIDKRADEIYRQIAKTASPKTSSHSLAKNAPTSAKVARVEITRYSDGQEVHAELNELGQCVRTFTVTKGAA
jgi:hypothetical protein